MNSSRLTGKLLPLLLLSLLLSACAPAAQTTPTPEPPSQTTPASGNEIVFMDSMDNLVRLPQQPEKVAVLFSSFAELWSLAGGQTDITVGESVERGFASDDVLLVDDGAGKSIDYELLLSYQPDFVIVSADIAAQAEVAEFLRRDGIPCAQFRVENFTDYLYMLQICTEITGDIQAFETHGLQVAVEIDDLLRQVAQAQVESPRILFIRAGSSASATKAKTADDNFVCAMLRELGCENIADQAPVLLDGLSLEEILLADPDYIFISTMGKEEAARAYLDEVFSQDAWQGLTAIREGHYSYLSKDLFHFKPNARWGDAYRTLIELVYPGLLEEN